MGCRHHRAQLSANPTHDVVVVTDTREQLCHALSHHTVQYRIGTRRRLRKPTGRERDTETFLVEPRRHVEGRANPRCCWRRCQGEMDVGRLSLRPAERPQDVAADGYSGGDELLSVR